METRERVERAATMFQKLGPCPEFELYLQNTKKEDPLAFSVVEVMVHSLKQENSLAIRKGRKLISRLHDKPYLAWQVFFSLGISHMGIGEMETAESYFLRALGIAETLGDERYAFRTRFQIHILEFFGAKYEKAYSGFMNLGRAKHAPKNMARIHQAACELVRGEPEKALHTLNLSLGSEIREKDTSYFGALEVKALCLRIMGKFNEAMEGFIESSEGFAKYNSAYLSLPIAKALEISRLAGLEAPPGDLVKKAVELGKKGGWGEQAAACEIEALLIEDDSQASKRLYAAAQNYLRASQNVEALLTGLISAQLAWRTGAAIFVRALKMLSPLLPIHPGFKKDPLLGNFMSAIEPFLMEFSGQEESNHGVKAYLIGRFRLFVDGKEIRLKGWRREKAVRALLYLLLSHKHRVPMDHLFYLLWPRRSYNPRNKRILYVIVNTIRKHLERPELLVHYRDFYQLEDVWTDLEELENLVRLADATDDPVQKEEYLSRARELARGELLPEFPYDRHIDEYRQFYKRLRKKLGLK